METNLPNQDQGEQQKSIPDVNNHKRLIILSTGLVVLVVILAFLGVYFQQKSKINNMQRELEKRMGDLEQKSETSNTLPLGPIVEEVPEVINNENQILNEGEVAQETAAVDAIISIPKVEVNWEKKLVDFKNDVLCPTSSKCYKMGKITSPEEYRGYVLYMDVEEGMGYYFRYFTLAKNEDGSVSKYYLSNSDTQGYTPTEIAGITDIPNEIPYPGSSFMLKKNEYRGSFFKDLEIDRKIFNDRQLGDVYLEKNGCLVVELPDHTAISYNFIIPFAREDGVIDATFLDGSKNKEQYGYISHTCAALCNNLKAPSDEGLKDGNRFEIAGKTINGDDLYKIKDKADSYLTALYNDEGTLPYYSEDWGSKGDKSKYTYDQFMKMNPYLFWKDPLGRWVEFKNTSFDFAAEMCKPVVYLYPEQRSEIAVNVSVDGFLTKTEPRYAGGWHVFANPDGSLESLTDGKKYDYLLWEAMSLSYPQQQIGWVISRENLSSFLDEKLSVLGLKGREITDFKEYWLARLTDKPYYQISFIPKRDFDLIARLTFSPKAPDTFIRVMMSAKGLDEFQQIPEQNLSKTPDRKGFTVVEWGGSLE
jgi:hypothetical protein